MDYYSGAPEPTDYDFDNNGNVQKGNKFFKNYSFFVLLGIAALVGIFIFIFLSSSANNAPEYNKDDDNSYLKSLIVFGGYLDKPFDKENFKYEIEANSTHVQFECELESKKAEVEGCDLGVEVIPGEVVEHCIKVTAQDGNVTRYYFKISKSDKEGTTSPGGIIDSDF